MKPTSVTYGAGLLLLLATAPAMAIKHHRHHAAPAAAAAPTPRPSTPYSFYPETIEGGIPGNLPFNNQIRKHTDPLNANGGR